ncbi:MAG: Dna2/Cas4 domain-containing protein [Thermodesulfovibrionales bacterium]
MENPNMDDCYKVQLCAQAICLEEMMNGEIKNGSLFYGQTRRREDVVFDERLRLVFPTHVGMNWQR